MIAKRISRLIIAAVILINSCVFLNVNTYAASKKENMADIAASKVGNFARYGNDYNEFTQWYNMNYQPWCAMFVSWCASQAGLLGNGVKKSASCREMVDYHVANNTWQGAGYTPSKGDLIFFDYDKSYAVIDHVGIVYSVSNGVITTVEGNAGNDTVKKNTYSISNTSIYGFGVIGSIPDPHVRDSRYPLNIKAYTISTADKQTVYTASHSVDSGHYITGSTDLCTILEVYTDGCCKVNYPTSKGSYTAYVPLTYFINSPCTHSTGTGAATYMYRRADLSQTIGEVYKTDTYTVVGASGTKKQIIYPLDAGGYKLGWCDASALSVAYDPEGAYDTATGGAGNFTVTGWCFDRDSLSTALNVHIYIDGNFVASATANKSRTDVNAAYNCGNNHGFSETVSTELTGSHTVSVYAINTGGGNNKLLGSKTVSITKPTYTISYNANGGSGAPGNQTKTKGVNLTLSSDVPTRTGYTFLGWAESSDAVDAAYKPGGTYTKDAAATLFAVWQPVTYTIKYDANGGTGAPASQIKTYGTDLNLSSVVPLRTGYTFSGWATSTDASSVQYIPSSKYVANENANLYAVWKAAVVLGDVNGDNDIDFADATIILQADAGLRVLTEEQRLAGDVNGDGEVDFADATLVLQYDSGMISSF